MRAHHTRYRVHMLRLTRFVGCDHEEDGHRRDAVSRHHVSDQLDKRVRERLDPRWGLVRVLEVILANVDDNRVGNPGGS